MSEGLDHTSSKSESKKTKYLGILYTIIGAIIGIAVVRMFRDEGSLLFKVLGGTVGGFLVGLIPFFIAKKRGDEKMAEDHAWLGEILNEAGLRKWCRGPNCTTCLSIMFRVAYLARAARVAGIKPTFGPDSLDALQALESGELSKIFDYLTAVSPKGREKICDALVAGVRQLSPGWQGSDGLRLILMDIERLNLQGGMLKQLSTQLEGTPGGDERQAMQDYAYRLSELRDERAAVEKRRAERQQKKTDRLAVRLRKTADRNSARQEFLDRFTSMSATDRLLTLSDQEVLFPIEMIPRELVPTGNAAKSLGAEHRQRLIRIIGQRKGSWGRLRKSLEACGG